MYAETTILNDNDDSYLLASAINYGPVKYKYEELHLAGSMFHDNPKQEANLRWITAC